MKQYYSIKNEYKDAVLFFRLGDFYEMFDTDAIYVSKAIGLTLTQRNGIPMCGVPYHASENYISKLIDLGNKIAICEQQESNGDGKGIVDRKVVEVLTPASITSFNLLKTKESSYLASLHLEKETYSFSYIDLSTAEFVAFSTKDALEDWFYNEIAKLNAKELLLSESLYSDNILKNLKPYQILITKYPKWLFDKDSSYNNLINHFKVNSLRVFNFDDDDVAICATGAIFDYLKHSTGKDLSHITDIKRKNLNAGLLIDEKSRINLEIVQNSFNASTDLTLFSLVDRSITSVAHRLLKTWLLNPLTDINLINERLNRIDFLQGNIILQKDLEVVFNKMQDIERLVSRLALDKAHAKDLLALKQTLIATLELKKLLGDKLELSSTDDETLVNVVDLLERAIHPQASVLLNEGGIINDGYNKNLDEFRLLSQNGLQILDEYADSERSNTKINLRLKENRVIGYFFELNKNLVDSLPSYFIRRQSLNTGERYKTKQLEELEDKINNAKENIVFLEKALFSSILNELKPYIVLFKQLAIKSAVWDIALGLTNLASEFGYSRPQMTNEIGIEIEEGRHPIIESVMMGKNFIPNSLSVNSKEHFMLITGPNMAGKSTYLRQTALIVLMAQIGSYVSAKSAKIGIVDQIFCRLGSGDYLAKGESTFLVEMSETARILHGATDKSLVIMDEVGRGTGSDDGLALARAIMEYLANKVKALTLFATHYHELTLVENPFIKNYHLDVLEENDQIYFIKKIKAGAAAGSYGIHVAMLAKLPKEVIDNAKLYLDSLLEIRSNSLNNKHVKVVNKVEKIMFNENDLIKDELLSFNVSNSTPLDAINFLNKIQQKYKDK